MRHSKGDTLQAGLDRLRAGHVGLVVLVNKYDGIDLPGDACRILVFDGLPEARGEIDRLGSLWLTASDALLGRQVQRIEQGMGRGIRSNDDHCVVLLLGRRLTGRLHKPAARDKLSTATRAQLELSDEVADQLRGKSFEELGDVIDLCLRRDPDWSRRLANAVVGLKCRARSRIFPESRQAGARGLRPRRAGAASAQAAHNGLRRCLVKRAIPRCSVCSTTGCHVLQLADADEDSAVQIGNPRQPHASRSQ